MTQLPRGCRDFPPAEMEKRRFLENSFRETVRLFNFREILMPTFEHSDLFIRKSGEEIVKQLYVFQDKGGRELALRPEITAQVIRFYSQSFIMDPKPMKFFYFGNCFRYERPQKGRYREFWQFGVEILGTRKPEATVELLTLAEAMYRRVGLRNYLLKIGNVGILRSLFGIMGLDDKEKKEAFTLLDRNNFPGFRDFLELRNIPSAAAFTDFLSLKWGVEDKLKFDNLLYGLVDKIIKSNSPPSDEAAGLRRQLNSFIQVLGLFSAVTENFVVDLSIARGLDYYTDLVFEIEVPTLGAESQVCGGGEYSLDKVFDIDTRGSLGFAIGFDRTLLALEAEGAMFPKHETRVFIIAFSDSMDVALQALGKLREAGIVTDIEMAGRGLGKAFKYADKLGVSHTVVIGEDEKKSGTLSVKDMKEKTQKQMTLDQFITSLGE